MTGGPVPAGAPVMGSMFQGEDGAAEHRAPYQLLAPLSDDELARLTASIRDEGFDPAYPVLVDEAGNILDGHHRAKIARSLGIAFPAVVRAGLSEVEKRLLAVERNRNRRQLSEWQAIQLGRQIEPDVRERARQRQGMRSDLRTCAAAAAQVDRSPRRSDDEVAEIIGLGSGDTFRRQKAVAERIEEATPDLVPKLEAGELSLRQAKRLLENRERAEERRTWPATQIGFAYTDQLLANEAATAIATLARLEPAQVATVVPDLGPVPPREQMGRVRRALGVLRALEDALAKHFDAAH